MTTIAYRQGVMAADSGVYCYGSYVGDATKIARNDNGDLVGASGRANEIRLFIQWFMDGEKGKPPFVNVGDTDQVIRRGIIVRRDKSFECEMYEDNGFHSITAPYFAIGSGADLARGVMFHGGNPVAAVRAAVYHDMDTYGAIMKLSSDLRQDRQTFVTHPEPKDYVST